MIKIIAIGNRIMGDDGVALFVLEHIRESLYKLSDEVDILIGETDHEYCINQIKDNDIVIIIDSRLDGSPVGTVSRIGLERINHSIQSSQHQMNLPKMLLKQNHNQSIYLIGISIKHCEFSFSLSPETNNLFELISDRVIYEIDCILKENY